MWTSERSRKLPVRECEAEVGLVTLGGDPAGVNLGGERRWLPVYCPGGYAWRPSVGDKVLVLKAGAEQESPCILGVAQDGSSLQPGEVRLSGKGSSVSLNGNILGLNGQIQVNGTTLEDYIRGIVADVLGGGESDGGA